MPIIGNIYSKSAFANLTDFETNGGFSVSGGKINTPADSSKYIRLLNATQLDKYTVQARFKWLTDSASDGGLQVGLISVNTTTVWSLLANLVLKTGDANRGKVRIFYGADSSNHFSTSAIAVAVNDVFLITLDFNNEVVTATVVNETQGVTVNVSITNTGAFGAVAVRANTSRVGIQASAVAYEVQFLQHSSNMSTGLPLVVGDSLSGGFYVGAPSNRWANIIGAQVSAGGGDKSTETALRTFEIINNIQPSVVYLMIGANDIGNSLTLSSLMARITAFVLALETAGIPVIKLVEPPGTIATLQIRDALVALYKGTTITDVYDTMLGSGTSLNASYDSGDGLHMNAAGNSHIAALVSAFVPVYTIKANQPNVVVCYSTSLFSDIGINDLNVNIIYRVDSSLVSFVPGRPINGITGFEAGKGYYIVSKVNRDLSYSLVPPGQ